MKKDLETELVLEFHRRLRIAALRMAAAIRDLLVEFYAVPELFFLSLVPVLDRPVVADHS